MGKFQDLTGQKFGRLTVIELHHKEQKFTKDNKKDGFNYFWLCQCECGSQAIVSSSSLNRGNTKSCGCLKLERVSNMNKNHGLSDTKLHKIWLAMRRRCNDKNFSRYKWYGARGITVCEEWNNIKTGFINFYNWSIKNGYKDGLKLTIDRIDFNGNYEPSNCRFVTFDVQANNTRRNHYIIYNGITKTMAEWCKELGLNYGTVQRRLNAYNWTVKQAFETPIGGKK